MEVKRKEWPICYYAVPSGGEVDFLIETSRKTLNAPPTISLVQAKLSQRWQRGWEKPARALAARKKLRVKAMIGVYLGD